MSMEEKYDRFYAGQLMRENFDELRPAGWPRDRVQAILRDVPPGESVMDVGCGNGVLLYHLRHRFRQLIGLEFSPHRLAQARLNLSDFNFRGVQGSAEDMGEIASGSVDVIVTADVIEHIPDVYRAAEEMLRVLRPGGFLVVNTPNVAFMKKRLYLLAGRFPSTSQPNEGIGSDLLFDGGHLHYFTFRSLALVLQRAGFELVRRTGFGPLGRLSQAWPGLLSSGVQWVCRKPGETR